MVFDIAFSLLQGHEDQLLLDVGQIRWLTRNHLMYDVEEVGISSHSSSFGVSYVLLLVHLSILVCNRLEETRLSLSK
jgi:hypothetical protein